MKTSVLTFTRFVAAIYVVILHFGIESYPFNIDLVRHFFSNGTIAVSYFFFISGFVMAIAYYKKGLNNTFNKWNYWINRFSRLYPIYIISLGLFCFMVLFFWKNEVDLTEVLLQVFLIQAWFKGFETKLNFPGWSLSAEVLFYFLFPFILNIILKYKFKLVFIVSLLLWVISQIITMVYSIPFLPIIHLSTFLFGVLFGVFLINNINYNGFFKKYSNLILFIALALLVLILSFPNPIDQNSHNGLLVPIFAIIVIGFIFNDGFISKLFSNKIFILLGEISYGIYILQYPALLITRYLNDKIGNILYSNNYYEFYIHIIILIILSIVTYYTIELPSKKFIRHLFKR